MSAREQLARYATEVGYPAGTLTLIARATIPDYEPGRRLSEWQIAAVLRATEVCVAAGASPRQLELLAATHRRSAAAGWEQGFWRRLLHAADARCARVDPSAQGGKGAFTATRATGAGGA